MIVVSGEARSGTSLMMLILNKLGMEVAGEKYLTDRTPEMNPSGIWEVRGTPYQSLTPELLKDFEIEADAIKIMSHKIWLSDDDLIDKIIWMVRDPREVIVSQRKQFNYKSDEHNYAWYCIHMDILVKRLVNMPAETLFVEYKSLIKRPRKVVRKVAEFLNVPYTKKAANVVNKKYYRSKANQAEDDPKARAYFKYIQDLCV